MLGHMHFQNHWTLIGDETHSWHQTPSEMASAKASTKGRFVAFEVAPSPGMWFTKFHGT